MNYVSLFAGIEAASVAWHPLGWKPLAFAEIEPFPCAVLERRFPDVPNLGDVTKVDWSPYRGADVVVGGSPCQAFSVAGRRAGLDDPRGRLMLEYVRAVRDIGPRWVLWENVPGVLSQDEGRAFSTLVRELAELGYGLCYRVLDAQFFGVAQRRRRVFLVGGPTVQRAAAVLFEPGCVPGGPGKSREKRKALTAPAEGSTEAAGGLAGPAYTAVVRTGKPEGGGKGALVSEECSMTLTASGQQTVFQPYVLKRDNLGADSTEVSLEYLAYTLGASARPSAVAVPDDNCLTPWDNQAKRIFDVEGPSPTLCTTIPAIVTDQPRVAQLLSDQGGQFMSVENGEVSPTLHTNGSHAPVICMTGSHINSPVDFDVSGTLVTDSPSMVACVNSTDEDVSGSLMASDSKGISNQYVEQGKLVAVEDTGDPTGDGWCVRRLTPVECERLQGFPDGWTDIYADQDCYVEVDDTDAEPIGTDEFDQPIYPKKISVQRGTPDGPRYKAIGNSMAVPVMRWIGERIQEVDSIEEDQ